MEKSGLLYTPFILLSLYSRSSKVSWGITTLQSLEAPAAFVLDRAGLRWWGRRVFSTRQDPRFLFLPEGHLCCRWTRGSAPLPPTVAGSPRRVLAAAVPDGRPVGAAAALRTGLLRSFPAGRAGGFPFGVCRSSRMSGLACSSVLVLFVDTSSACLQARMHKHTHVSCCAHNVFKLLVPPHRCPDSPALLVGSFLLIHKLTEPLFCHFHSAIGLSRDLKSLFSSQVFI